MSVPPDKGLDRITPGQTPQPLERPVVPQAPSSFEAYMQGTAGGPPGTPPGTPGALGPGGPTPMDITQGTPIAAGGASYDSMMAQSKTIQDSLGNVGQQLNDQKLRLRRSQSLLVRQKLDDANSYLRAAGSKLGANMPESKVPPGLSGVSRFIAMVNDGQDQLVQIQQQLQQLSTKGDQINPGDMMAIQVKMGLATQEIEYTSTLLSRVIQGFTTLINTQL